MAISLEFLEYQHDELPSEQGVMFLMLRLMGMFRKGYTEDHLENHTWCVSLSHNIFKQEKKTKEKMYSVVGLNCKENKALGDLILWKFAYGKNREENSLWAWNQSKGI